MSNAISGSLEGKYGATAAAIGLATTAAVVKLLTNGEYGPAILACIFGLWVASIILDARRKMQRSCL